MNTKKRFSGLKSLLAIVLCLQLIVSLSLPALAAPGDLVLDSAWEVEKQNDNLVLNEDGSITITTEKGTIGDANGINNVLYHKLTNSTDYYFTVKVSGNFTENFHGAYLMITSGKELENAVGVVRRYHGYLGGTYGTNMLMGVMQDGTPAEYYEAATDIGNEFYLKLQKQNGRITGFYAAEYSDNAEDWNQIIDGDNEKVDKGDALVAPAEIYVAVGACAGGTDAATPITFSELRVNGEEIPFAVNSTSLSAVALSGEAEMDVAATQQLTLSGTDYSGTAITNFDSVTYTSSDEKVATVSDTGLVTAVANGTVTITAEATLGTVTKTATFEIQVGDIVTQNSWTVASPDGKTKITLEMVTGGALQYRAEQNGVVNIPTSPLGLNTNLADFSKGLVLKSASEPKEINETYPMISGKSANYTNHCFEQTITFTTAAAPDVEFDVVLRAYDDGTAFRYGVRAAEGTKLLIQKETTGLQLPAQATVFWMNYASATWNYESNYETTTTEGLTVGVTPSIPMLYGKDGVWTLFTESNVHGNYCGSMLRSKGNGLMDIAFAKTQNGNVITTAPFESPWRVAITGTPEDIVENTLVENLADPADYETYKFDEWVDPGLSSWSWVANWGSGISDQSKKETHLNWIEFGAEIGWDYYILDEGWAAQGRGNVQPDASGMREWWPEVKAAAEEAGVKLWAWVHVSDIRDDAKREKLFAYWASEGIVGIKPDFFDGEAQSNMQLYDELYEDAAKYGLMLLVHGANKPTGEVRTWPNVYGREAIKGQESGGITAQQYTIIPFVRAAIGPAEVTEELRSKDVNKTTQGFQIALTALIEDGIHSMGSAPDVYRSSVEGMSYYTNYPDTWDRTEFAGGEIGQYVSIARLTGTSWYVSGISVDPRTMEIDMDFLDDNTTYTAQLYKENGRNALAMEIIPNVNKDSKINVDVLSGGGYAMRLIPNGSVDTITDITAPETLDVEVRATVTPEISVTPADALYKDVVWSSADETIATVSSAGVITGIKEGTTTITVASAFNDKVKKEIKVNVVPSSYIYLDLEAENATLKGATIVDNAGASGGKHVGDIGGDNGANGTATFTFNTAHAATATLEIYYATYSARDFAVTVNGGAQQVINGGGTGDWTAVGATPLVLTIELVAGENKIVIGGANAYAPNLDRITVSYQRQGGAADPDQEAADKVIKLIDDLGEIKSLEQEADVKAARAAFDALTDAQKALVTNQDKLVAAEAAIEALKPVGDVDGDGNVNVSDIIKVKNLIMAGKWTDAELAAGDLNNNKELDVADIIAIKNIIMGA